MSNFIYDLVDVLYDVMFGEDIDEAKPVYQKPIQQPSTAEVIINEVVKEVLPSVINKFNYRTDEEEEKTEYITIEGDLSEFPIEYLELDDEYPAVIRLAESDDANIFGKSLFEFRKNGAKFGCDVRLIPYYKIPEIFYEKISGEEILVLTDTLAGIIPLVDKARKICRNPNLYFGIKIYNDPDQFMLSSLNENNKLDDNVLITLDNGKYELSYVNTP